MQTDLIESMKCKNCVNATNFKGKLYCQKRPTKFNHDGQPSFEEMDFESSCSYFEDSSLQQKIIIKKNYEEIKEVLKYYCDLREDYYDLIAIWVIGTWFHREFESYPFLFLNAMRGSGKTRLMKLLSHIMDNGEIMASPTEAVLFRTNNPLCIDEFEGVGSKEKIAVRELLNASYKQGIKIKRMRKTNGRDGENMEVQEFDVYRPIVMANIWGMEEVLADRCISLTLERSSNVLLCSLIEDFLHNKKLKSIKSAFLDLKKTSVVWCSVVTSRKEVSTWNDYIYTKLHNNNNNNNYTKLHQENKFFDKILDAKISGRDLELFFPLFRVAQVISEEVLDKIISIAKTIVHERKIEEITESKDVMVYEFVANRDGGIHHRIKDLTTLFKQYMNQDDKEDDWLNTKWFGRALKRLNLIKSKRRFCDGIQVVLDIEKARIKAGIFQEDE